MLEFRNVTKTFGDITALSDINLSVDDGEFVFITGPSGAGKTTLVRLILREFLPDEGEIILDDVDLTTIPAKSIPELRQNIGVVFQDFKLLPERTLRENVELALAVVGLEKNEWDARVEHVLKLVGLEDRSDLFPSQLSGGELQRTSLARALVVNPKIVIADEPTGNLDWDTADRIMELFDKINKEGKTVIVATHHQFIVDKMNKRTVDLKGGKISDGDKGKKESKGKKASDMEKNKEKEEKSEKDKKIKVKVEETDND
jgi:cell division transport system ATP-binding protein